MTQKIIDDIFQGELGQQLYELFTTADDGCFIRYEEALLHTVYLDDKRIETWHPSE